MDKKNRQSKHFHLVIFLSVFLLLLFGVVIISVSMYGLPTKQELSDTQTAQIYSVEGANVLYKLIPNDTSLQIGTSSNFKIEINTNSKTVDAADIVIKFDKGRVRGESINFSNSVFDKYVSSDIDNNAGVIRISQMFSAIERTYTGTGTFAFVVFTPLSKENIQFNIDCSNTGVYREGENLFNCTNSAGLEISNITDAVGGGTTVITANVSQPHKTGPLCDKEYPDRPVNLKAVTGSKPGQVHLTWTKSANTTHYTVTYGEKWMEFQYGSPNIGDTDQFYVNGLKPGALYYFVITAVNDCASSGYSDGASAYAGKAVNTAEKGTTVKATTKATPKTTVKVSPKATAKVSPTPVLEVAPQATSSGIYDDWNSKEWTVTTSPEPSTDSSSDDQDGGILLKLAKILPWVGLGVLLILGIMLIKFIKGGNDQELPTKFQNFNASDELGTPTVIEKDTETKDPLAPPFGN